MHTLRKKKKNAAKIIYIFYFIAFLSGRKRTGDLIIVHFFVAQVQ